MSAVVQGAAGSEPLSPTTGEPVSVPARRNRLGIWLCIASDAAGTVALLVAYSYLWSLNVNGAWAPPKDAWASPTMFWIIVAAIVVSALLVWWGVRGVERGASGRLVLAGVLATLVVIGALVLQIVQLSTFPFGPSDGAYASATYWLALATALHLSLVGFLMLALVMRTRRGLISPANPHQARLIAMWVTWVCIAAFLGALFATTMTVSPNSDSPPFGTFKE